ncbi:MAG: O-methyltransferase [Planctomycetota bacterium]|jgi:predicted O-methyltransferase YrrM
MIVTGEVEEYLARVAPESEGVLAEMEAYGRERKFPFIGPLVGRVLGLLAQTSGAKRVFECGSGYGYSAWWFATAMGPDGEVTLTDGSAENVERARDFLGRAGLAERCRFLEGEAVALLRETPGPFDIILVDIDKEGYPGSLEATVEKLRPGGLLITDNVLWSGEVAKEQPEGSAGRAIQEYNRLLYAHPELDTVILPLRDGVAVCRKR